MAKKYRYEIFLFFCICIVFRIPFRTRNVPIQICGEASVKKFLLKRSGTKILVSEPAVCRTHFYVREFSFLQVSFAEKEMWK